MNRSRFRYALEPVLLTRRWTLDALLGTLAEHNAQLRALAIDSAALQSRYAQASTVWKALTGEAGAQPVQRFAMNACYLGQLAGQLREHAASMSALESVRDEVITKVVAARRALDAVEQHRRDMKDQFERVRISADFRLADDQWNTQHTGEARHGH